MSYIPFRQQCVACLHEWDTAFGVVHQSVIADPTRKCPACGSPGIIKIADGWKMDDGSIYPPQRTA